MATAKSRQTAAAKAAAQGESDQYIALTTVDHDGDRYAPGEVIPLDPISAEALLAVGAVQPAEGGPQT